MGGQPPHQQMGQMQQAPAPPQSGPAPLQRANSMPNLMANPMAMMNGGPFTASSSTSDLMGGGVPTTTSTATPIPLLPNILDHNQVALQLQNVVNQNIINTNTMNFVHSAPSAATATAAATTPTVTVTLTPNAPGPGPRLQTQGPVHRLSATPTLLNVADGVIPGVEAGLYWYHPQIDQSAVLLPAPISLMPSEMAPGPMQQVQAQAQGQAPNGGYGQRQFHRHPVLQQMAIPQQIQQQQAPPSGQ